jgi:hypothetical protein
VEHGGRYSLVTFNNRGISISDLQGMVQRAGIPAGQIVPPGELFRRNKALISGTPGTGAGVLRDLNLAEGEYTLTITAGGNKPQVLRFDAVTGALKP